jgi:hypothetical protein
MTDMTAFESLIAQDVRDEVGPAETINALAIARKARADSTRWRFPSVFSALKFVAAGVIVALFGGFLFAGILTEPQGDEIAPAAVTESPPPTKDDRILPGVTLSVEEVEPGVFRVLGDGVHDLSVPLSDLGTSFTTGHDGSVWLRSRDEAIRLGRAGTLPITQFMRSFQVGPDGTVWVIELDPEAAGVDGARPEFPIAVRSFDGETWKVHSAPSGERLRKDADYASLHVASDGTVLVSWPLQEDGTLVMRLGADGWQPLPGTGPEVGLVATDDGVIWAPADAAFYREGQWQRNQSREAAAVSRDGTHWFVETQPVRLERNLGDGWTTCPTDGAPERFHGLGGLSATTDGSLWAVSYTHLTLPTTPYV